MVYPEIRPSRVHVNNTEEEVVHFIDQFNWYSEGFEPVAEGDDKLNTRYSIVQFDLPTSSKLYVRGSGIMHCEAFLFNGAMWQLYDYDVEKFIPERKEFNGDGFNIFTTHVSPFLQQGGIPLGYERVYLFPLFGTEYFEIRAKVGQNVKEDKMTLSFVPDRRDGVRRSIAEIFCDGNKFDWR